MRSQHLGGAGLALVGCLCVGLFGMQPGGGALCRSAIAADPAVKLQVLNWKQTLALIAKHKGKVVVVDLWSTGCEPCVREFPNLVALHKKYGADVACVSVSCDYAGIKSKPPEFYREKVQKFLERQGASFDNVLCNVPSDDVFTEIDLASIPAVMVFGRDGKLVKRFDNDTIKTDADEFTYEKNVNKLVESLVKMK